MEKAVLISCFDWYSARLEPIRDLLIKKYDVKVLTSDYSHTLKEVITERHENVDYIQVKRYKKNLSVARLLSHIGFSKNVYKILKKEKPNVIYCLLPPNHLAKTCAKYKKNNQDCKLIFDVIDMWPESMPIDSLKSTPPYKLWRNYRDKYISKADYLITECDLYYSYLSKIVEEEKHSTVYLYKKLDEELEKHVSNLVNDYKHEPKRLSLCYLGSINHIIDIEGIVKVINEVKRNYNVELHIVGDGEAREELIEKTKEAGANVIYHGKIFDEKEKASVISKCDFGINMMKNSVMVGLTIKSIDYFCFGLPVINNIKCDTNNLVEKYGVGINVSLDKDFEINESLFTNKKHQEVHDMFLKLFSQDSFKDNVGKVFHKINVG